MSPRARDRRDLPVLRAVACAGLALALACGGAGPEPAPEATAPAEPAAPQAAAGAQGGRERTDVEIVGVDLRVFENARVRVRRLDGVAVSNRAGQPVALDDPSSFTIEIDSGEMWVGYNDLSVVMNEYTFAFPGAPVGHLHMAREEDEDERDRVELKGRLKSGFLSFEIEGEPEVTDDGRIRIRTRSIQALDVPVGGLLHALGLEPADILGHMEERGLTFAGDDLILDASLALPPPRMHGRTTSVRVEDDGLRLTFGRPSSRVGHAAGTRGMPAHYLWFRHGTIKIGRMTQTDAYLLIADSDASDDFDFYGERMNHQLAAAWSRMSEQGNLTMFVPDYEDIR